MCQLVWTVTRASVQKACSCSGVICNLTKSIGDTYKFNPFSSVGVCTVNIQFVVAYMINVFNSSTQLISLQLSLRDRTQLLTTHQAHLSSGVQFSQSDFLILPT